MVKSRNIAGRMIFCIAIITVLFLYVIAMFYRVQIMRHKELLDKAQKKYIKTNKIIRDNLLLQQNEYQRWLFQHLQQGIRKSQLPIRLRRQLLQSQPFPR